jgi:TRAP-type C4-dicarboxylate transport system substrate-binding protein
LVFRVFSVILIALLAAVILSTSCTNPPTKSSQINQSRNPPDSRQQYPIKLKLADWNPPSSGIFQITQKMVDIINSESGGRLQIITYSNESLAKMNEVFRATQNGVTDMSYWVVSMEESSTELSSVTELPFMGLTSMQMGTYVNQKLYDNMPEVKKEWVGLKVLGFRTMPGYHGQFTSKEVVLPEDLKGLKMITADQKWSDLLSFAGALPMSLGIGDWHLALERGLVEGQITHFPVSYIFSTLDLYNYFTMFGDFGCGAATDCYLVNIDVWNSLSPDLQKIIEDAVEWRTQVITDFDIQEIQNGIIYAKNKNSHFTYLTADQIQAWQYITSQVVEKWIKDNEAKGFAARKVYDEARNLIQSYPGK